MIPALSIIIVNYKTPHLLLRCIESVYRETSLIDFELIVVDNDSQDQSETIIKSNFPQVHWIQNKKNVGFGIANNIGIEYSKGEYILLLNSDTIVIDRAIEGCLNKMKDDVVTVGAVTCQLLNEDKSDQKSVFYYNASFKEVWGYNLAIDLIKRKLKTKESLSIKALHGAFIIFNKARLEKVGYFDPDFFMYSEEFDWCRRIIDGGLELKIYKEYNVIHLEGKSSEETKWSDYQRVLSIFLLFVKTHGRIGGLGYILATMFNSVTNFILCWFINSSYRKGFFRSQKIFWTLLPLLIKTFFSYSSKYASNKQALKY